MGMSTNNTFINKSIEFKIYNLNTIKKNWLKIYEITKFDIQIKMDVKNRKIDLRIENNKDSILLERSKIYIESIILGFKPKSNDLLNYDLNLIKFRITEKKKMNEKNISRAIGRVVGSEGKVKKF